MKKIIVFSLSIVLVSILNFSCSSVKNTIYLKKFSKDTTIENIVKNNYVSSILKNDILTINISSLNAELDASFNNAGKNASNNKDIGIYSNTFIVDERGEIKIHYIGKIKVEGLSLAELKSKIELELSPYMKEPIATVQYANKKITVMGEIPYPKVITLNEEEMSLFDAIVTCGDLKETSNPKDIVIIRDSVSKKIIKHINLEDHDILNSPWYYVKANDIVYIKKDPTKIDKEERSRKTQTTMSLIASLLSLAAIILNIFIK
jgi:polysaccharide export outer membrane protein